MRSKAAELGFSLLEVMVAFTILAMVLGALFQVFSNGMSVARSGDRFTRATVIAKSKLAELGAENSPVVGVSSGTAENGFHWRVSINPYTDEQLSMSNSSLEVLVVDVEVFWEEAGFAKTVSLKSLLLGSAP